MHVLQQASLESSCSRTSRSIRTVAFPDLDHTAIAIQSTELCASSDDIAKSATQTGLSGAQFAQMGLSEPEVPPIGCRCGLSP